MQYIIILVKKVVLAICMLYTVDLIAGSAGVIVPINYVSIISVTLLGLPAIVGLFLMQKLL